MTKQLTLNADNRAFRHWADAAPNCISGVTVSVYTDDELVALTVGMCIARYTDAAKLRELIAGLTAVAERLEAGK